MATTQPTPRPAQQEVSRWAVSAITFAATMAVLVGAFQMVQGIVAILDDDFFVGTRNYTFELDTTAWGWIHLIVGAAVATAGFGLFARATWAGVTAIVVAFLSALANFFFAPYYPVWCLVVIALNVWVIWALTRPGALSSP